MIIEHLKLKQNEPFARNHGDSLDVSQEFRMVADERGFVWMFDDKTKKQWLIPFAGARAWRRAPSDKLPASFADEIPLELRQVRVSEEAMMEHDLDAQLCIDRHGFEMVLDKGVVYITDKARKRELAVPLTSCEYFEIYPGQHEQLRPMADVVKPLKRSVGRPRKAPNAAQ